MSDVEYVVQPQGELDIASVPALRTEWLQIVDEKQPDLFVVDLRDVTYLDSTALGAFVAVRKHQERHGGGVIVMNAEPRLAKLFEMTGLADLLHVNQTDEHHGQDGFANGIHQWNQIRRRVPDE